MLPFSIRPSPKLSRSRSIFTPVFTYAGKNLKGKDKREKSIRDRKQGKKQIWILILKRATMAIFTSADKFKAEVENLIAIEVDRLKETMAVGFVEDYPQYKNVAGKIAGLRTALDLLNDAEKICNNLMN